MESAGELLKTLAEHVRAVYFTIMALALLLLAASLVTPARSYDKPIRDLQAIIRLGESRREVDEALTRGADELANKIIKDKPESFQAGKPIYISVQNGTEISYYAIATESAWGYPLREGWSGRPGVITSYHSTLAGFIRFWNSNIGEFEPNIVVFKTIESRHLIESSIRNKTPNSKARPTVRILTDPEVADLRQQGKAITEVKGELTVEARGPAILLYHREGPTGVAFRMQPDFAKSHLSIQRVLRKQANQEGNWLLGTFEKTFPELYQVTSGLTQLPPKDLLEFLRLKDREEREQHTEQVEVFGAKIPADKLGICGVALLIALQLYFLLNVRRLYEVAKASPGLLQYITWIGGYPDRSAHLFVLASGIALPFGVLVALVIKIWGVGSIITKTLLSIATLGSAAIALATATTLVLLWHHRRRADQERNAVEL